MRDAETIIGLVQERGKKGLPLERVYKLLFNRELYLKAYGKIYRNKGAMTHGVTEETPDGMSMEKIDTIIEALRYERYQWLPARRTYIPKKDGKMRPLGMPVWSNKLVQEVIRLILEAYYEGQFSDHSQGFRPKRGCHTALREIYYNWKGTTWFIEGDIAKCFDRLDHEYLLSILSEKIHDGRLINLIKELLRAGYLEEWKFNMTLSGTPQGGILSPLLANIYLDRLDKFVETVLIPKYTRGTRKRLSREYLKLMKHSSIQRQGGKVQQAQELKRQAQSMPAVDPEDPNYRRLKYVRYADDFLLGFDGPKSEAEEIKQQLEGFLRDELKLELSKTKTLITHARSEAARFLGYEVAINQKDAKRTKRADTQTMCRSINGEIALRLPRDVLEEKCNRYKRKGKVVHRRELERDTDYTIMYTYQSEYRGIANYYQMAHNVRTLKLLKWVMEQSLVKTLAHKHQMVVSRVYRKYEATHIVDGKPYRGLIVTVPREGKKPLVAEWGGIPLVRNMKATLEDQPPRIWGKQSELEQRLLANICEYCGNTENIQVHHIRALKDLKKYTGREKPEWVKIMVARQRKTLVLCRTCHEDMTFGRPMRRPKIKLEEVKALQQARQRY